MKTKVSHRDPVKHRYPKDSWLTGYLKGNMIMPQAYDAGALFLAYCAMNDREPWRLEITDSLSQDQICRVRKAMQAAHRVRYIPAGDEQFINTAKSDLQYDLSRAIVIDDEKIVYIWNRFRERAIMILEQLLPGDGGPAICKSLIASLESDGCRELLNHYRWQYDRRNSGCERLGMELRKKILRFLVWHSEVSNKVELCRELFDIELIE